MQINAVQLTLSGGCSDQHGSLHKFVIKYNLWLLSMNGRQGTHVANAGSESSSDSESTESEYSEESFGDRRCESTCREKLVDESVNKFKVYRNKLPEKKTTANKAASGRRVAKFRNSRTPEQKKEDNLRRRISAYRLRDSQPLYNPRETQCRWCLTFGHGNCTAITSCLLYCAYCESVGHSRQTCTKEAADVARSVKLNADAASYKVSRSFVHVILFLLTCILLPARYRENYGVLYLCRLRSGDGARLA